MCVRRFCEDVKVYEVPVMRKKVSCFADKTLCAFKSCGAAFRSAFKFLSCNKTQAVITALGFFIAAFLVTAILFAAHAEMTARSFSEHPLGGNIMTLKLNDCTWMNAAKLRENVTEAENVLPYERIDSVEMYGNSKKSCRFPAIVTDNTFFDYAAMEIVSGRTFSASEVNSRSFGAVVSEEAARELFGESDPIGQQVKLNNQVYNVLGVMKGVNGWNCGSLVIVPNTAARILLGRQDTDTYVFVGVKNENALRAEAEKYLNDKSSSGAVRPDKNKDYGYSLSYSGSKSAGANTVGIIVYIIMLILSGAALLMLTLYPSDRSVLYDIRGRNYSKAKVFMTFWSVGALVVITACLLGILLGIPCGMLYAAVRSLPIVFDMSMVLTSLSVFLVTIGFGLLIGIIPGVKYARSLKRAR